MAYKNNENTKQNLYYNEWLAKTAQGDQLAFKQLYNATSPLLHHILLRVLKQKTAAEDCMQETYLKVWNNAHRFQPEKGQAMTWLSRIARNTAYDYIRAQQVRLPAYTGDTDAHQDWTVDDIDPEKNITLLSELKEFTQKLSNLSPIQQECVLLSYYFGHTHSELAEKFNTPLGTIKSWIRRGKEQLTATGFQTSL